LEPDRQIANNVPEMAHNNRGPNIPIPDFYGKQDENFTMWLKKFRSTFASNNWNTDNQAKTLAGYLHGRAFIEYCNFAEEVQNDFEALTNALAAIFATKDQERLAHQRFEDRKQNVKESVENYANELQELSLLAFPNMPGATTAKLLREHFISGLLPSIKKV
jgi:hypothetical protein